MQALQKQIRRARRRLILQSFTGKLAWCWFVTLLVAAVAIGAGKFWPMDDGCVGSRVAGVGACGGPGGRHRLDLGTTPKHA